jgi:4-hydroxy-tetrahydrodipicolinate synthase
MKSVPVWAMVPTPFDGRAERICGPSLAALTAEFLDRGCSGLIALGVIAEPAALSASEKLEALGVIVDHAGAAPVIATSMATAPSQALGELAMIAAEYRDALDAVMIPVSSSDPATVRRALADAHAATGLPVLLQDLPSATGISIGIDDLRAAIAGLDFLFGIKCEGPPTFDRIRRLREATDACVMAGLGGIGLVDDLLAGADSVAAGISAPEVLVRAVVRAAAGDHDGARRMIGDASGLIYFETQAHTSVAVRKEHWRRQGVIEHSTVRPPAQPYLPDYDRFSRAHGFPGLR